jgi:uncharacterized Zn-finger protein
MSEAMLDDGEMAGRRSRHRLRHHDAGVACSRPPGAFMLRRGSFGKMRRHMADQPVPHFHNDQGVESIRIGVHEFMCIGALPPFDHPHVFLDMGDEEQIVCPYCSTLYQHDPELAPAETRPAGALFTD